LIKHLKRILFPFSEENKDEEHPKINEEKKLQIATCALLVEMARADNEFTSEEKDSIISIMKSTFDLDKEYVEELVELSEEKIEESISIYEFSSVVNNHFSSDEKFELVKNLWRLIYVDDTLHHHEDHLIKRIGGTLNLDHKLIIGAKLLVKEELKKNK
jgi:uncharacterized tellurite resistance protein B-like protein